MERISKYGLQSLSLTKAGRLTTKAYVDLGDGQEVVYRKQLKVADHPEVEDAVNKLAIVLRAHMKELHRKFEAVVTEQPDLFDGLTDFGVPEEPEAQGAVN